MFIAISILILSLIPGIIGAYFVYKDRNKIIGITLIVIAFIVSALGFISNFNSKQNVERIERYSFIAKMGPTGSNITAGKHLSFTGGLPGDLEGTYLLEGSKFTYICTDEAIDKMIAVTKSYPDFPFSYFGIATCKLDRGDDDWMEYGEKALKIFKETTKIEDHNPAHDESLKILQNDLKNSKKMKVY